MKLTIGKKKPTGN